MLLKKRNNFLYSVTIRLTLWYGLLFGIISILGFTLFYYTLSKNIEQRINAQLKDDAIEIKELYKEKGFKVLKDEFIRESESYGKNHVFFQLISSKGQILASSDLDLWNDIDPKALINKYSKKQIPILKTIYTAKHPFGIRTILKEISPGHYFLSGISLERYSASLNQFRNIFLGIILIMIFSGSIAGWFMAHRAMAGVQRVTQSLKEVTDGDFSRRVPLGKEGQEIDELATAFNSMLDRLEILLNELKEVTNNVAHDLRSPITRIRGIAETTLISNNSTVYNYKEMASTVIEESDRLVGMINTMLEIAAIDAGVTTFSKEPLNLKDIINDAYDLFYPLAESSNININIKLHPQSLIVYGDRGKLQRMFANIIDNAIKYSHAGSSVNISMYNHQGTAKIIISDTGQGISQKDIPHIFERFYRCDKSRSTEGNGLGLSLALALAKLHGGHIEVSSILGKGSVFTITLPLFQ